MSRADLLRSAKEYLGLRRALGFKLYAETWLLPDFVAFLTAHGSPFITTDLAVRWAQQPPGASTRWCARRLGVARCFAKHRRAFDPRTEVPPPDLIPGRTTRRLPHLYTDAEIAVLMREARRLRPPIMAATYEALLGLLAATGMRVGEALALDDGDLDWGRSLLKVRHAKFQRTRLVPLHRSAAAAIREYVAVRDRLCVRLGPWLFTSTVGTRVIHQNFLHVFRRLVRRAAIGEAGARRPRLHDLRHTFAVNTVRDWYRSGTGLRPRMPDRNRPLPRTLPALEQRGRGRLPQRREPVIRGRRGRVHRREERRRRPRERDRRPGRDTGVRECRAPEHDRHCPEPRRDAGRRPRSSRVARAARRRGRARGSTTAASSRVTPSTSGPTSAASGSTSSGPATQ